MIEKTSNILTGVAGEYFVAAELSRMGHVASITLRNTKGIDVVASNQDSSKSVAIQVKTNRGTKKSWMLNKKAEGYCGDNLYYVFVNLRGKAERPDFHIVPSMLVAEYIRETHKKWLVEPGRKGRSHRDNPIRIFNDKNGKYLEKWELLGL